MYCKNCGAELADELKYCPNCGKRIGNKQSGQGGFIEWIKKYKVEIIGIVLCLAVFVGVGFGPAYMHEIKSRNADIAEAAIDNDVQSSDAEALEVTADNDVQSSDAEAAEVVVLTQKLIAVDDVWEMTRTDVYNLCKEIYPGIEMREQCIDFMIANGKIESSAFLYFDYYDHLARVLITSCVSEECCRESVDQFKKTIEEGYGEPYYNGIDTWIWEGYRVEIRLTVSNVENNEVDIQVNFFKIQNE